MDFCDPDMCLMVVESISKQLNLINYCEFSGCISNINAIKLICRKKE